MGAYLLQVRGVSEQTRRALKARAAARGESLNTYLRDLLDREAARPTVAEVLARAASRAEHAEASVADVLDALDSERSRRDEQIAP